MQSDASMQLRSATTSRNHANAVDAVVASAAPGPLGLQGAYSGPYWDDMKIWPNLKRFFWLPEALFLSCGNDGLTSTRVLQPRSHARCILGPKITGGEKAVQEGGV